MQSQTSKRMRITMALFAAFVACSLIFVLVGPIVLDAISDDDDGSDAETIVSTDASIEEAFLEAAQSNPDDPATALAYANYLANTGRLSDAIPWYEQAISVSPDDPLIRFDFARSLANGGFDQDAELQYLTAIELDDQNPQAHFFLGELYETWSPPRVNEAMTQYERTIEFGPETFVAEQAGERLVLLSPPTASPAASPEE